MAILFDESQKRELRDKEFLAVLLGAKLKKEPKGQDMTKHDPAEWEHMGEEEKDALTEEMMAEDMKAIQKFVRGGM